MRIMELDQNDLGRVPTKAVVELVRQADGSVRATWHDEDFRHWMEQMPPGVQGDDGEMVELRTHELLFKYAAKLFRRSQVYGVATAVHLRLF